MPVCHAGHRVFRSILAGLSGLTVAAFILFNMDISSITLFQGAYYTPSPKDTTSSSSSDPDTNADRTLGSKRCRYLPGANDTLVIIRTGATALRTRLPVHFQTTLQCIPHYVILSDMEEEFQDHHIHDVLSKTSTEMQATAPEFAFYREVHRNQHRISEFIGENTNAVNASAFHRKAWDLDKWKFVPSVQRAFEARPDAKWFVFIEDDTFLVWSNLLDWVGRLDWREPYFLGLPVTMDDQLFACGGSGWVLSQAAMQRITEHMASVADHYEDFTNRSAYGDLVLGYVAEQSGLVLTGAWPLIQREAPSTMEYTEDVLCYPVATFHHVDASEVQAIWNLEQEIIAATTEHEVPAPLLHSDVFKRLVYPHLAARIDDWDNFSDGEEMVLDVDEGFEECRRHCQEDPECVQFRATSRKCTLAHAITLGWMSDEEMNSTSGWMMHRIAELKAYASCGGGKWDFDTLNR